MRHGTSLVCLALLACVAISALATFAAAAEQPPRDGKPLYMKYCASCHGTDGRGKTPLGQLFARRPPDLTRVAARRGGWFPEAMVREIIDGRIAAHGAREMPVWGEMLTSDQITLIAEYLGTIQERTLAP
jgi:mono/diheme cytochrome c family protein